MPDASSPPAVRRITVRSVSCRGVKSFVPFQKPPLYAAVSLGGRREKTPADPNGGENADWDGAVFGFDFDGAGEGGDGLLRFEVKAQVTLLGNKLVGTTCVPVSHLGGGRGDSTVSYQVLAPDGKPNGSLSFVYAVTGGGVAYQQPQIYALPNGARPEQDLSPCCTPPSSFACPPPPTPNFVPQGSSYPPPPESTSLYPPLHDMLTANDSLFPASNSGPNSSYPPAASCAACWVPSTQHMSNYPPPPPTPRYYPHPPPSAYPPPQMNPEFPAPTSSYPPPPPESGSMFQVLPRSMDHESLYRAPSFQDSVVTYPELPGPRVSFGGSYYPPSGLQHHQDGASWQYCYPPHPGARYS